MVLILLIALGISFNVCPATPTESSSGVSSSPSSGVSGGKLQQVPVYGLFETTIVHNKSYVNPFSDVTLDVIVSTTTTATTIVKNKVQWYGYYDGGHNWVIRWMPDTVGAIYNMSYAFSDKSATGYLAFQATSPTKNGILRGYEKNKRWFAYNGNKPIWLKSYYTGSAVDADLQWTINQLYQPLLKRGYNHLQVSDLLPLAYVNTEYWRDSINPYKTPLISNNAPSTHMNLTVLHRIERHLKYLNDKDMNVFFFQGWDGKRQYKSIHWATLSNSSREFYVRYLCSRFCPFSVVMWQFTWETDTEKSPRQWASIMKKHDPWNHLRTAECENPLDCDFDKYSSLYTFEGIENHIDMKKLPYSHTPGSHYNATILGYTGKGPVYMMEGNGIWYSCWNATQQDIRRNSWAVVMAGGSFTWQYWAAVCGLTPDSRDLMRGPAGVDFDYIDILTYTMTHNVPSFHTMNPAPHLLKITKAGDPIYCMFSEQTSTYMVAVLNELNPTTFSLDITLKSSKYKKYWIDTKTGAQSAIPGALVDGWNAFTTPAVEGNNFVLLVQFDA